MYKDDEKIDWRIKYCFFISLLPLLTIGCCAHGAKYETNIDARGASVTARERSHGFVSAHEGFWELVRAHEHLSGTCEHSHALIGTRERARALIWVS